jgi:hypothetical protein
VTPAERRELVRALAAVLIADVRQHPDETPSGVAPPGTARTVVGRLHPRPLAATPLPLDRSSAAGETT